jgi:hypothetical protein
MLGTKGYRYTLRICNIYCSFTTTFVALTRLSVTKITLPVLLSLNLRLSYLTYSYLGDAQLTEEICRHFVWSSVPTTVSVICMQADIHNAWHITYGPSKLQKFGYFISNFLYFFEVHSDDVNFSCFFNQNNKAHFVLPNQMTLCS